MAAGGAGGNEGTLMPTSLDFKKMSVDVRKSLKDNFDSIKDSIDKKSQKFLQREINAEQKEEAFRKSQEQLNKLMNPNPLVKMRNKLTIEYDKWIVKNKLIKGVSTGLKGILQGLKGLASGGIGAFIETLFILALLGPKFAASLLRMVVNLIIMLAKIIIPMIPGVIKTFIDIAFEVIPPLFLQLVNTIFPMIGEAIDKIFMNSPLVGIGKFLFGEDGVVTKFFRAISGFIPYFLMLIAGIKVVMGIMSIVSAITPIITGLFTAIKIFFFVIKGFALFMMANPIVLIIAGIVLYLVALWKWGDKILAFIEGLPEFLGQKFGVVGRVIGEAINIISTPLKIVIKLIQAFKKGGVSEVWKVIKDMAQAVWDGIKWIGEGIWKGIMFYINIYKTIFTWIGKVFMKVIKFYIMAIKKVFTVVFDVFTNPSKYIDKAKEGLSGLGEKGSALLGDVREWFSRTIGEAFEWLKEQFYGFADFISDFIHNKAEYLNPLAESQSAQRLQSASALRRIKDYAKLKEIGVTDPEIQALKDASSDERNKLLLKYLKKLSEQGRVNSAKFFNDPIAYLDGDGSKSKGKAKGDK